MKLSDLTTGQEALITDIKGKGAIKQRINEMGFISGKPVKAIKSAPFKDPVEYEVMGYNLTIRRKDAEMVEVETGSDNLTEVKSYDFKNNNDSNCAFCSNAEKKTDEKTITVALVGNPNCGKTTIFNYATNSREHVANYSGVTVAAKEASFIVGDYTINVIDLPGTYSLKPYSPEELFVYDYLVNKTPDLVLNVLDSGNLERNLFLTTQLIDMQIKTVAALNMYDELEDKNIKLNHQALGQMLGIPFIPTVGKKGTGLQDVFETIIDVYNDKNSTIRSVNINYGKEIEEAIDKVTQKIKETSLNKANKFSSIQILEGSTEVNTFVTDAIIELAQKERAKVEKLHKQDFNTEIVNTRYGFINGALAETFTQKKTVTENISQKIDKLLTNKVVGIPMFFAIIWFIFFATFKLGEVPMGWIEMLFEGMANLVSSAVPEGLFATMVIDGIIGGVGGVFVFLPNIIILFFLISFLEDSGYMARTAFLMDKTMHKVGLHGKSFIPLLMGFGCNIPAVMATRTIESKRDRMVTMFITPFMSCSARLPVYVLFITAFFPKSQSLILFSMYGIGIVAALLTALILNKTVFKKTESPFVMELPPYRVPTIKAIGKHTWYKTSHFIKKMGTVILVASIVVWALGYFPQNKEIINKYDIQIAEQTQTLTAENSVNIESAIAELEIAKESELLEQSYISRIGKAMEPVFKPLGFDWKMSVSILTGLMAKEVVVSSMGILYNAGSDSDETSESLISKLQANRDANNVPLSAYMSFLVFVLLYFPCLGTLIAINKETKGIKWTLFSAAYPLVFAWIISFGIYQIGALL